MLACGRFQQHYGCNYRPLQKETAACQEGFDKVKRIPLEKLVQASPSFDKMAELCTDASNTGLGAVLMQAGQGNKKHPITQVKKK